MIVIEQKEGWKAQWYGCCFSTVFLSLSISIFVLVCFLYFRILKISYKRKNENIPWLLDFWFCLPRSERLETPMHKLFKVHIGFCLFCADHGHGHWRKKNKSKKSAERSVTLQKYPRKNDGLTINDAPLLKAAMYLRIEIIFSSYFVVTKIKNNLL